MPPLLAEATTPLNDGSLLWSYSSSCACNMSTLSQIPVITVYQPRLSRWNSTLSLKRLCGEDYVVCHTPWGRQQMTFNQVLGHWFEDSGWWETLREAEVAAPDIVESILKVFHVSCTQHAQQAHMSWTENYLCWCVHCVWLTWSCTTLNHTYCQSTNRRLCVTLIGTNTDAAQ